MKFIKLKAPLATTSFPRSFVASAFDKADQEVIRVFGESQDVAKERLLIVAKALKEAGVEVEFIPSFNWKAADFRLIHPEHDLEARG